jgi:hypothetical protein
MQTLANFFESINKFFGVKSGGELIFHPVFIGIAVVVFIYCFAKNMKYFCIAIAGVMGGAAIFHYLYPGDTSHLGDLLTFIGAMGLLGLLLCYLAFIKD